MPAVEMYMPSAAPRSTTFVSPVTTDTPAAAAASAMSATIPVGRPSRSPPRARRRPRGQGPGPIMARSLTVPWTARWPTEPPGKRSGLTTKVSAGRPGGPREGVARPLRRSGSRPPGRRPGGRRRRAARPRLCPRRRGPGSPPRRAAGGGAGGSFDAVEDGLLPPGRATLRRPSSPAPRPWIPAPWTTAARRAQPAPLGRVHALGADHQAVVHRRATGHGAPP